MRVVLVLTALLFWFCLSAFASEIVEVAVQPSGIITSEDSVSFEVLIATPSSAAFLFDPTELVVTGTEIAIDLFADSGDLDSPDMLLETVDVGVLAAGDYSYTIRLTGPAMNLEDTEMGTFIVFTPDGDGEAQEGEGASTDGEGPVDGATEGEGEGPGPGDNGCTLTFTASAGIGPGGPSLGPGSLAGNGLLFATALGFLSLSRVRRDPFRL